MADERQPSSNGAEGKSPDLSAKPSPPVEVTPIDELEQLKSKLADVESLAGDFKDKLLRKAAEFENFKKRAENDYADRMRYANEDLLTELLPVLDDFERSLKSMRSRGPEGRDDVLLRGVELIYQKLLKIFELQGLKHYDVVGKPFDAHLHDALMQIPKDDVPPHTVVEEVEKGYMLYDKVLRHAKVIVSGDNGDARQEQAQGESEGGRQEQ